MSDAVTPFGRFVRQRRLALGLNQKSLAKSCGMTQTHFSSLEIKGRKLVSDELLQKLAVALQCEIGELQAHLPTIELPQPTTDLGHRIRSAREALGLSIAQLAKKAGMSEKTVWRFEFGIAWYLSLRSALKLAVALEQPLAVFTEYLPPDKVVSRSALGQTIRQCRISKGISARELSRRLDLCAQAMSAIESGKTPLSGTTDTLENIRAVLGLPEAELRQLVPPRKLKQVKRPNALAQFMTDQRLSLDLRQKGMAAKIGIQPCVISQIETGRLMPGRKLRDKIMKAFGVTTIPGVVTSVDPGLVVVKGGPVGSNVDTSSPPMWSTDELEQWAATLFHSRSEMDRIARKLLLLILDKKRSGYQIILRHPASGQEIELEFLF